MQKLSSIIPQSTAISIQEALYSGNSENLQKYLRKLLLESVSVFDTTGENFYHGLILGLCVMMDNRYEVASNREAGDGRYDICLIPRRKHLPGILIELEACKNSKPEQLTSLAKEDLNQIDLKMYDRGFSGGKATKIVKYGVAFSGKKVEIETECNSYM